MRQAEMSQEWDCFTEPSTWPIVNRDESRYPDDGDDRIGIGTRRRLSVSGLFIGLARAGELLKSVRGNLIRVGCLLLCMTGVASASTVATPTFSPTAGTYTSSQTVTISDSTSGATIYYTTNGSTPTTSSTRYTSAITVSSTETVKAIGTKSGYTQSAVGSAAYTITPPAATPTFSDRKSVV